MYKRILLPLDGSSISEAAARLGLGLAEQLRASLVLVHRVEPQRFADVPSYAEGLARARRVGEALLHEWCVLAQSHKIPVGMVLGEGHDAAQIIHQASLTEHCDLIVMGTHGRSGLSLLSLGSVTERVMGLSTLPVLLVRRVEGGVGLPIKRILVGLDGSAYSQQALAHADGLAQALQAQLTLLHVMPDAPFVQSPQGAVVGFEGHRATALARPHPELLAVARSLLEESLQRCHTPEAQVLLRSRLGQPVGTTIGSVAQEVNADLIVLGTLGLSGLGRVLLGSVADEVVSQARQPVLLVRPPHGETT